MKFNYRAVSNKDRLKKTILFMIILTIPIAFLGGLIINLASSIGFLFVYYSAILAVGYVTGYLVRYIGKGASIQFLYVAGIFAFFTTTLALYFSHFFVFKLSIIDFIVNYLLVIPSYQNDFSLLLVGASIVVAIYQANTVQIR